MVSVLAVTGSTAIASARATGTDRSAAAASRGPVGWQSYRRLDLLPFVRSGVATYQSSSYDPTNHNDDGYTGRYSCVHRVPEGCVMAQHTGPGELESVWTAGNQEAQPSAGGNLMIQLDGRTVVDETWPELTAGRPTSPFAFPLALAPTESWGGSSIQVPMTFRRSMRVISQFNPHYFHVVYRTFAAAAGPPGVVSRNPPDVIAALRRAGTRDPKPGMGPPVTVGHRFQVAAGDQAVLARVSGAGAITALGLRLLRFGPAGSRTPAAAAADVYRGARLRISFDGRRTVDAPLGEFFGSGLGPARVRSLMFAMDGSPTGWLRAWWPMPFARTAEIELDNSSHTAITAGQLRLNWARGSGWASRLAPGGRFGYFHAQGHRGETVLGRDWTFLRTRGAGTFQGVTLTIEGGSAPFYLEGNERAYVDGARKPQIQGTGTEDFFDGGWYFYDHLFTLPLSGYTAHQTAADGCPSGSCKTAYRLMIADSVPFTRSLRYEIQHGPSDIIQAVYSSTAYWYERRGPTASITAADRPSRIRIARPAARSARSPAPTTPAPSSRRARTSPSSARGSPDETRRWGLSGSG